jgi:hypothetical protein
MIINSSFVQQGLFKFEAGLKIIPFDGSLIISFGNKNFPLDAKGYATHKKSHLPKHR